MICPTSLLGNWQRELARFAPGVPVRRYHGGDRHLDGVADDEVVLVSYGVVRRDRAVSGAGVGRDRVAPWRAGGLAVAHGDWHPDAEAVAEGRQALDCCGVRVAAQRGQRP